MRPIFLEPPSRLPGGVIIHIHSIKTGELLLEQKLVDPDLSLLVAEAGHEMLKNDPRMAEGVVIIGYDGDTGEWMGPPVVFGP